MIKARTFQTKKANTVKILSLEYMTVEELYEYLESLKNTAWWKDIREKRVVFSSPS